MNNIYSRNFVFALYAYFFFYILVQSNTHNGKIFNG